MNVVMTRFWLQSLRYMLRWLLIGLVVLSGLTLWAVAEPLPQPSMLTADAIVVVTGAPLEVEMNAQLADLLNAGAAPVAYLTGPHAESLAVDMVQRGVPPERLRILVEADTVLSTLSAAGHRRLIVAASPVYRLTLIRQAQVMGFAVSPLVSGSSPTFSERIAAVWQYWRTLLIWRPS